MAGVAATRRKGRGKGRKGCPDGGGHGREGGAEPRRREGGAEPRSPGGGTTAEPQWRDGGAERKL
eukprot:13557360-Alexandrium_andersonii.AAC.1